MPGSTGVENEGNSAHSWIWICASRFIQMWQCAVWSTADQTGSAAYRYSRQWKEHHWMQNFWPSIEWVQNIFSPKIHCSDIISLIVLWRLWSAGTIPSTYFCFWLLHWLRLVFAFCCSLYQLIMRSLYQMCIWWTYCAIPETLLRHQYLLHNNVSPLTLTDFPTQGSKIHSRQVWPSISLLKFAHQYYAALNCRLSYGFYKNCVIL